MIPKTLGIPTQTNIRGRDPITARSTHASTALRIRAGEFSSLYDSLPWLSLQSHIRLLHPDQGRPEARILDWTGSSSFSEIISTLRFVTVSLIWPSASNVVLGQTRNRLPTLLPGFRPEAGSMPWRGPGTPHNSCHVASILECISYSICRRRRGAPLGPA